MTNSNFSELLDLQLRPIVEAALAEDIRSGDITTAALIPASATARASMIFREEAVVCGLRAAELAFLILEPNLQISRHSHEGDRVVPGTLALLVEGPARPILTAERVALNLVQRLSGVATATRRYVDLVEGTGVRIVEIRKTTPGLRLLEKYAVRCGGGMNHRFALDDLILIKDNHIAVCGGIVPAIERARAHSGHAVKIEVECDTLEQVGEAAQCGADIILFDNMGPHMLRAAVEIVAGRALTEASGGINLGSVRAAAETGVDIISVGALTHSVIAIDVGLDLETVV